MMLDWINNYGYEPRLVATKLDKLKKSQVEKNLTEIYNELELGDDAVLIPFSAETREGRENVLELIDYILEDGAVNAQTEL